MNLGKLHYDEIPIPSELQKIIQKVMQRVKREMRRRRIFWWMLSMAALLLLLFGCANIAPFYEKGAGIPIIGTIVQFLNIGAGGV